MGYQATMMPIILAFFLSILVCPVIIPVLRRFKFRQYVREDGPRTHLKKAGTPTMGGIIILLVVSVTVFLLEGEDREALPVLFATVGFGMVGFLDDYIKIIMKQSEGLTPWQKLALQAVVGLVFVCYYLTKAGGHPEMLIPFTGGLVHGRYITMPKPLFALFCLVVMLGTANGTNFTDGLDGLVSGVTLLVAVFFTIVAAGVQSGILPITTAVVGTLAGFLAFNVYPASVFMGDTGSLALGGFVSASALVLKLPLFIVIVGVVYMIEVLSVMLQVGFFRMTGGKRIFKMAPIHHHFEQCGWSETRIVTVFSLVTSLCCLLGLAGL
ncbi:MAG: phospho-N-acetylmuramoyl-pentapeptide-transferase [Lachnospiraceae bacterium]|nr:phospho-N-acetylmuramoyl-pentapeptide-transferase [Lachnospiraceae bacterium]